MLLTFSTLFVPSRPPAMAQFSSALPNSYPLVYVYPEHVEADVGDTFTIAVVVYNLTSGSVKDPWNPTFSIYLGDLYGFDIQFSWDPTVIQYVNYSKPSLVLPGYSNYTGYTHPNVTAPVEKYPNPISPSPYAGVIYGYGNPKDVTQVVNVVNETGNIPYTANTNVKAWFSVATFTPAAVFNGNGTLFVMMFKVLRQGSCLLKIEDCILADENGVPIGRSETAGNPWLNTPHDGTFNTPVIPEFHLIVSLPTFVIGTLFAAIVYKRKRTRPSIT